MSGRPEEEESLELTSRGNHRYDVFTTQFFLLLACECRLECSSSPDTLPSDSIVSEYLCIAEFIGTTGISKHLPDFVGLEGPTSAFPVC